MIGWFMYYRYAKWREIRCPDFCPAHEDRHIAISPYDDDDDVVVDDDDYNELAWGRGARDKEIDYLTYFRAERSVKGLTKYLK